MLSVKVKSSNINTVVVYMPAPSGSINHCNLQLETINCVPSELLIHLIKFRHFSNRNIECFRADI